MEASRIAWVSTVHVPDDGNGEGFGMAHYTLAHDHRFATTPPSECPYGPSHECTIDTREPFHVGIEFNAAPEPLAFTVILEQQQRRVMAGPVQYRGPPTKGSVPDAKAANVDLRERLDAGMTLVASYWATDESKHAYGLCMLPRFRVQPILLPVCAQLNALALCLAHISILAVASERGMGWLDAPCKKDEQEAWGCSDAWVEHPEWPWICNGEVNMQSAYATVVQTERFLT